MPQTVGSRAVKGKVGTSLDGVLAAASYLPLCGDAFTDGDGITPLKCAHLDGGVLDAIPASLKDCNRPTLSPLPSIARSLCCAAEQREVDAFHIAFVPGAGTRLLGTPWYGSPHIVEQWVDVLP